MNTLVIYDNNGVIFFQVSGSVIEPNGLQHMYVEVPQGKYVASVDVSGETHAPVLVDFPKSETQLLKDENTEIKLALAELAEIVVGGA
jgi:hypothetical protein